MKKHVTSLPDKKRAVMFIVCMLIASIIVTGSLFAVQAQTTYMPEVPAATRELGLPNIYTWEDLVEPLRELGIGFRRVSSTYPFLDYTFCLESRHFARYSPNTTISISTNDDIHVLFSLARVAISYNSVISMANCVTYALDTSGMYDYWRQGVRELTQPGRNKQITALVENYTFSEIYARVLHYRPCMLPQFHNLGFFLDISADDLAAMGRGQSATNAIIIQP